MRDFNHGWRRKLGCVTLVMVVVLGFGWIRSHRFEDSLSRSISPRSAAMLFSFDGCIGVLIYDSDRTQNLTWEITPRSQLAGLAKEPTVAWYWQWLGFRCGDMYLFTQKPIGSVVTIPYWSIALALSVLAGYLILGKPRKVTNTDTRQGLLLDDIKNPT